MRAFFLLLIIAVCWAGKTQAATYAFQSDAFAWESASQTVVWDRTDTSYPNDDDQTLVNFTGGFSFKFGGVSYSSVRIHSNGALQFGASSRFHRVYANTDLPVSGHDGLILPYWDDINPRNGGTVTYQQKGTAPNRYFVVSWENVPHYSLGGSYTFQVILYENGQFKFQYGAGNAAGASATIGVEVANSDYTLFSYNNAWGTNGTAIRWKLASSAPSVSAFYAFEDPAWSGVAQEVYDRSGNERHGTRVGNAQVTASGRVCQGASIPSNSSANTIDAVNTAFDLDANLGSKGAVTFWYRSANAWRGSGSQDAQLLDATTANNRWFYLIKDINGRLRLVLTDSNGGIVSTQSGNNSVSAGTWVHIAATWYLAPGSNQSVLRIYMDGVLVASANASTSGQLHGDISTLYLGDNRSNFVRTSGSDYGTGNSANGILDEVHIYNYEISSAQVLADMADSHGCELDVRGPGGFNAMDVGGDAITGQIGTKTAGAAFNLDLVALNATRSAQAASFNGSVLVDLLANTTAGVALDGNNCPITGSRLAVGTFNLSGSRSTHTLPAVADVWRDVRVRIRFPASGSPSITACSTDNFAIKPNALVAVASDADWQSAGTARTLNAGGATASPIHKAGRPFSLRVTGFNAGGAATSQYDGSPSAQVTCALPASGCTLGSLSTGNFSAAAGTVTSNTATYNEVGAISVVFTDSVFAAVDADDTAANCDGYWSCSAAISIGRFVPDRLDVALNTPQFRAACGGFTYLGQPFDYATAPLATVTAKNAAGATTVNYSGSLFKLSAASVIGQAYSAASGSLEVVAGSLPGATVTSLGAGVGSIAFSVGDASAGNGLRLARGNSPVAPFDADIALAFSLADADGVTPASNPIQFGAATSGNGIAFDGGKAQRFGRLRLANATGTELRALPVPLTAQYWNGQGFVTNTADNCTAIPALAAVAQTSPLSPGLTFYAASADNQLAAGETTATFTSPLVSGNAGLVLTAPGAGNHGYLDLVLDAPAWLEYNWDGVDQGGDGRLLDDNPRARVAFGKRRGGERLIIRREIY